MSPAAAEHAPAPLAELMQQYIDGDPRAFAELYHRLEPRLRGFLLKLVRDKAAVDDLLQLTMLKAHLARDRFEIQERDPETAVAAWYFAIARNLALDWLRQRQRQVQRSGDTPEAEPADQTPSVEELGSIAEDEQELVSRVREAIAELPPGQREVVELHKLKGMSMAEIAERLQLREGAVRVRAHRAYKALQRALGPMFGPGKGVED